ncbi:MAG: SDR family NAD(P)-dependent oxidoreductase, partial [Lachnospiraceae bacterium]|nr:SDR family NAD(P)-dependent oxidoreductase [Lachnospiraceae bacterium]
MDNSLLIKQALIEIKRLKNEKEVPIAIVGMDCRFPGGIDGTSDFWEALIEGRDCISAIPKTRWDIEKYYDNNPGRDGKMYVKEGGFVPTPEGFDIDLFQMSEREASYLDPQHRLFLELVWRCLEKSGINPQKLKGTKTGVYLGISTNDYGSHSIYSGNPEAIDIYSFTGSAFSMASGRISYMMGLRGPSISTDTACSSSLVCIHQACQGLKAGDCSLAIAGGVNLMLTPEHTIQFCKVGALSPTSRCKVFDAGADGYVRSEGGGVLLLKRLDDALNDKNRILAVIQGSAINNDGVSSSLTAPNGTAQQEVIRDALKNARLEASQISYIEAHGTGTPLGDPVEVNAINEVYGRNRSKPLYLGSVKSNLGHLEAAAGMASIIKSILMMQNDTIPANLHFNKPNPEFDWDSSPIVIPTASGEWKEKQKYAGVSAFGFSGTNAHIILGEAPKVVPEEVRGNENILVLSGQNNEALELLVKAAAKYIRDNEPIPLESITYTYNVLRPALKVRKGFRFDNREMLLEQLENFKTGKQRSSGSGNMAVKIDLLIEHYEAGGQINWHELYEDIYYPVDVPVTPILHKNYWINRPKSISAEQGQDGPAMFYQMRLPVYDCNKECFVFRISAKLTPFLLDHGFLGKIILPATAYLEIINRAGFLLFGFRQYAVENIIYQRAMELIKEEEYQVYVYAEKMNEDAYDISVVSQIKDEWIVYATAKLHRESVGQTEKIPPAYLEGYGESIAPEKYYRQLNEFDYLFGPMHQGIRELKVAGGKAWAKVAIPEEIKNESKLAIAHPALMDACSQVFLGFVLPHINETNIFITVSTQKTVQFDEFGQTMLVFAEKIEESANSIAGNIFIYHPDYRIAAAIFEYRAKKVDKKGLAEYHKMNFLYHTVWEEKVCKYNDEVKEKFILVWEGETSFSQEFCRKLEKGGTKLIRIRQGQDYRKITENEYEWNPEKDIEILIKSLEPKRAMIANSFYLWSIDATFSPMDYDIPEMTAKMISPLLIILKEFYFNKYINGAFTAVTLGGAGAALTDSWVNPCAVMVRGLQQAARLEYPDIIFKMIDLRDTSESSLSMMLKEVNATGGSVFIALRDDRRYVPVLKNYHITEDTKPKLSRNQVLIQKEAGIIDSLAFEEAVPREIGEEEVEIQVFAVGLNFHDVIHGLNLMESVENGFGLDCSGTITKMGSKVIGFHIGQHVAAFAPGCIGANVVTDYRLVMVKPQRMNLLQAAIIPSAYLTAYAVLKKMQLKPGDRVLIHAASGGLGLAVIQLARKMGLEIYATASIPKQYLLEKFGVKHIFNSRKLGYIDKILKLTDGEGVDGVINSFTGEHIKGNFKLLRHNGCFIELGERERISKEDAAKIRPDVKYSDFSLFEIVHERPDEIKTMLDDLYDMFEKEELSVLPYTVFPKENIKDALRYMQKGKHIGKILIDIGGSKDGDRKGTVIIAGGAGGLGFEVLKYLISKNKYHIAIVGRTEESNLAEEKRQIFKELSGQVRYFSADAGKYEELESVFNEIQSSMPPVCGLIHSAGIAGNNVIAHESFANIEKIFQGKVYAAWNFHRLTRNMELEFFILFSSVTAVIGSIGVSGYGMANSFLLGLAEYRKQLGLPCLCLNWGPWKETGMLTKLGQTAQNIWLKNGFEAVDTKRGINILDALIKEEGSISIMPVDWKKWLQQYEGGNTPDLLENIYEINNKVKKPEVAYANIKDRKAEYLSAEGVYRVLVDILQKVLQKEVSKEKLNKLSFHDMGIDSLMSVEFRNLLNERFGHNFSVSVLFSYPDMASLQKYITAEILPAVNIKDADAGQYMNIEENKLKNEPIAIVGIGCKFPGGIESAEDFYRVLAEGVEAVGDIPEERWNFSQYDDKFKEKIYCKRGAFITDVYDFDPLFFNISPLEAEYMDPQQRIFLEVCWKALEDAGYTQEMIQNHPCGVYAGVVSNDYFGYLDKVKHKVEAYEVTGNYNSMLSARISYFLNLKGPAITVDTACSSSAAGIHLACKAIQNGDCEVALAGGVTLFLTPRPYRLMCEANMLSASGATYAFDNRADGFIPGEGCGVVVLKPLSKALKDGNQIYGLIRDTGINQDGKSNGITAPSSLAQQELEIALFEKSGLNPEQITYIEAHGTGTKLGDPIEIEALVNAYGKFTDQKNFCAIGSLKPAIGHLQAAAGVASLIKVMLSLKNKVLFPTIHFENLNTHIKMEDTPFFIQSKLEPWKTGQKEARRAAINSFGFSGTNVCIIAEEYIPADYLKAETNRENDSRPYIIPLSAANQAALHTYISNLYQYLKIRKRENKSRKGIAKAVRFVISDIYHIEACDVDLNLDWDAYRNDSVKILRFLETINEKYNMDLHLSLLLSLSDCNQLCDYILTYQDKEDDGFLYKLAATYQLRRTQMKERALFIAESKKGLIEQLNAYVNGKTLLLEEEKLSKSEADCVKNWREGKDTGWQVLYGSNPPVCISAPVYPFDHKVYKINSEQGQSAGYDKLPAQLHQDYLISLRNDNFNSHMVKNREILPAAYIITLIWESCRVFWPNKKYSIQKINFIEPLYISGETVIYVNAVRTETDSLYKLSFSHNSFVHSTAEILWNESEADKNQVLPVYREKANLNEPSTYHTGDEWYHRMEKSGLKYGKLYRRIKTVKLSGNFVHANFITREAVKEEQEYYLNPYLLDVAIQPAIAFLTTNNRNLLLALPREVGAIHIYEKINDAIESNIEYVGSLEKDLFCFNIKLVNSAGQCIAELEKVVIYALQSGDDKTKDLKPDVSEQIISMNQMIEYLKNVISAIAKTPVEDIEIDQPLQVYGIDSFISLKIINELEKKFGRLPQTILFEYFNLEKLGAYLLGKYPKQFPKIDEPYLRESHDAILIPEKDLIFHEKERKLVEELRKKYEIEGLAYARKEIAPDIFIGAKRKGFFYGAKKDNTALAFLYVGEESYFLELAGEFEKFFAGYRIFYLMPRKIDRIGEKVIKSMPIGVLQRITNLPEDLAGKKYKHLRYAIKHFENSGACVTREYKINTDDKTDAGIIAVIDEWILQKGRVNEYIKRARTEILDQTFSKEYRFFITTVDAKLENVIIITPIPSCNGYLMDLEFYGKTMPLGGLEYAIFQIFKQLRQEGITELSLGATFGIRGDEETLDDTKWLEEFDELNRQGIFDGRGNYQFKNKFRTINEPLYLSRFALDTQSNLKDAILFIADPVGSNKPVETVSLDGYYGNPLFIPANQVEIDLLTDSWSELQRFAMNEEDIDQSTEAYESELAAAMQRFFPFPYLIPVSSGRHGEALLFSCIKNDKKEVIQNALFPTTRWNLTDNGYSIFELPCDEGSDTYYGADIDIKLLKDRLQKSQAGYVVIELANNAGGGSNFSAANLKEIAAICSQSGAKVIIDATRAIGNAAAIAGSQGKWEEILKSLHCLLETADMMVASLTKECGVNQGGIICVRDTELYEKIINKLALTGNGLSRVSVIALLKRFRKPEQIIGNVCQRLEDVKTIERHLSLYVPTVIKPGGNCILIDISKIPGLSEYEFAAQVFVNWLYENTGIRISVHSKSHTRRDKKDRYVRMAVPVGLERKEIDEIIKRIHFLKNFKKGYRKLLLLKSGAKEFGVIKNKYQFAKEEKGIEQNIQETFASQAIEGHYPIAVIGLSGRYPKAEHIRKLWDNLVAGKDCIEEIPPGRWDYRKYYSPKKMKGMNSCKWGGFLDGFDKFDAAFFKISPYEAEKMDPQQRLFLQEAWHVIEDAGYKITDLRAKTAGEIGVFVGATWSEYGYYTNEKANFYPETNLGSIAARTSYYLDFCGPSLTVDTHCSSSLTAIYLACESLMNGECKAAIAGGVNLSLRPNKYQFARHFLSEEGRCKSFGEKADGYVPSEGIGAVLLKPLKDAVRDKDIIYGVIKGAALGHGGKTGGVTVPNPESQARVIKKAYQKAKVDPSTISYIEAHGTGTPLGDPIEINGLLHAFGNSGKKEYCAVGSIKSNIGHTEAAAGIAQLTKVLLQMKYKKIVPSLFAEKINPEIDLSDTPFYIQTDLSDWKPANEGCLRRAGISSFGAGGVNCHIVVEEYPVLDAPTYTESNEKAHILPISSRSGYTLKNYAKSLLDYLNRNKTEKLEDIAYTLQTGREVYKEKIVFICKGKDELKALLNKYLNGETDNQIVHIGHKEPKIPAEAEAFLDGKSVDWFMLNGTDFRKKISLPGYPFAEERFWAPSIENEMEKEKWEDNEIAAPSGKCVLYAVEATEESSQGEAGNYTKYIYFGDDDDFARRLLDKGKQVIQIAAGTEYICEQQNKYWLDPERSEDYTRVINEIGIDAKTQIIYGWLDEENQNEKDDTKILWRLILLFKAANRYAMEESFSIICLGIYRGEEEFVVKKALYAFLKTIHLENPNFRIRLVLQTNPIDFNILYEKELSKVFTDCSMVYYEKGIAVTEGYIVAEVSEEKKSKVLSDGGVYIITGGVTGVGFLTARTFSQSPEIKLIICGRTKMNAEIEEKLELLKHSGAKAIYIEADVSLKEEAAALIKEAKNRFGSINGIIHSAGVIKDSYFIKKTKEEIRQVTLPKINGLRNLDEASANEKLDFIAVFSSLSSVAGNVGQCDYSFANCYMDHYMDLRASLVSRGLRSGRSLSINWPLWEEGGMNIPDVKKRLLYEQTGLQTLTSKDGLDALFGAIASDKNRILVTVGNQEQIKKHLLNQRLMEVVSSVTPAYKSSVTMARESAREPVYDILRRLISEETKLAIDKINIQDPFEDYGLDSIMIESITQKMKVYFGHISPVVLFEYQTIEELAEYLADKQKNIKPSNEMSPNIEVTDSGEEDSIAIIGVNGKYPDANTPEDLWLNLTESKNSIKEVPIERWDADEEAARGTYCKWGGFLTDVDLFDALLFNISPKEAETMDPQERLFIQNVWELMEQSGYTRAGLTGKYPKGKGADVGVFVGVTTNSYQLLMEEKQGIDTIYPISSPWSIANRISYLFNFTGPSMSVDTACSSSLAAIHIACESLKRKECRMAVVGGVNLYLHPSKYAAMCQLGMLSKSGKCHAFGKDADGFVPAEGIGSILLKPLTEAVCDGDTILGVVTGTAVRHGGRTNGYKVPSALSQFLTAKAALDMAGLSLGDLSYIEAHGTGTSLGDPIEIEGLMQLYENRQYKKGSCPIGSVKTNIGHSESAAGIAGLTKVLLQMKHRTIVPSLHSKELNSYIDFENTAFYVPQKIEEWKSSSSNGILRAGISSFGAGGVNAHIIVEEYPEAAKRKEVSVAQENIFLFSAKEPNQLYKLVDNILKVILEKQLNFNDLAYTLMFGREELEERLAIVANDYPDLIMKIRYFLDGKGASVYHHDNKNNGNKIFTPKENKEMLQMLRGKEYEKAAASWVLGAKLGWGSVFTVKGNIIKLPSYPFALKSYWVSKKERQDLLYLTPQWNKVPLTKQLEVTKYPKVMIIGTPGQLKLKTIIQEQLGHAADTIVVLGNRNICHEDSVFEVDTQQNEMDFTSISGRDFDEIYFLGALNEDIPNDLNYHDYCRAAQISTLALLALLKIKIKNPHIKILTNCSVSVDNNEVIKNIYSAPIFGFCKTIVQEYPLAKILCVDLSAQKLNDIKSEEIGLLVQEKWENLFIAYRDKERYVRTLTKQILEPDVNTIFTIGGTYLLFGGMGGIGYLTAEYIARRYQAKMILIGSSEPDDEKHKKLERLNRFGASARYLQANLADVDNVMKQLDTIVREGVVIDGIIHAAAIVENNLLEVMPPSSFQKVVGLQMKTCLLIERLRKELEIRNYIIFSSAASFFGNQGGANYSASNSLKDAFGHWFMKKYDINIKMINWGLWNLVGLGKEFGDILGRKFQKVIPISAEKGMDAFNKILRSKVSHTIAITAPKQYLANETDLYDMEKSRVKPEKIAEIKSQSAGKEEKDIIELLKQIAAANLKMNAEDIHIRVPLGEYGMDSIVGLHILRDLNDVFGDLPSTFIYENYTIAAMKEYLLQNNQFKKEMFQSGKEENMKIFEAEDDIAIIGLAGIYPKARNLDEFWDNLNNNRNCITKLPESRYNGDFYEKTGKIYTNYGGFIDDYDEFDPLFFQISPKEAKGIDPQERLFLQNAYHTFNDAGYSKETLHKQRVGVFVGVTNNTYQMQGVENFVKDIDEPIPFAESYSIANRVSYAFDLIGPSMSIDTACSSSLAAIHIACESLNSKDCDMALAGGVNLYLHPYKYASLCQMDMISRKGKCSAFQETADGFVPGEGIGAILLKPLKQAIIDGDNIQAVIKATSMNHGGKTNGYTVPDPKAQAELITEAIRKAKINPRTIGYVEAHGTGTVLGDPIEIAGLTMAFREYIKDTGFCALGSVKTNIGHLESASGIAGITKVLLQIRHKRIAPSYITDP